MNEQHQAIADIHEAKWPQHEREEYHQYSPESFAGPHLTFPIRDAEDVQHAAHLYSHSEEPEKTKHKIIHIARAKDLTHALPAAWSEDISRYDPDGDGDDDSTPSGDTDHDTWNADGSHVQESIILTGRIAENQPESAALTGSEIKVTIIKGGKSVNGYYYNQQALQEVARMIEGSRAYADHGRTAADEQVRSIRDLVGFYKAAHYVPPHAPDNPDGRVDATLHILEAASWLRGLVKEALSLGRPELIGLSVDIFGAWTHSDAHRAKDVTRVLSLNSCDIVTRPSAGGSFQRILHHYSTQHKGDSLHMEEKDKQKNKAAAAQGATTTAVADPPVTTTDQRIQEDQHVVDLAEVRRIKEEAAATQSQLKAELEASKAQRVETERILEQAKLERAEALL